MADNVNIEAVGTPGEDIAADEISGAKYQRVKLIHGADGVSAGDVAVGNPLPIADRLLEISRGNVTGQAAFRKFGSNQGVGSTEEVISSISSQAVPWMPSAAVTVEILSADAADGVAGAGAQTVRIVGLDASFSVLEEVVVMNGLSPVVTTGSFIRIFRAYVETVGTYRGPNIGQLLIRESGGAGDDIAIIDALQSQTLTSHYCVPAGKTLYVTNYFVQVESNKAMHVHVTHAPGANDVTTPFNGAARVVFEMNGLEGTSHGTFLVPQGFTEYSDIWASASLPSGTGTCFFDYSGILIDN